MNRGPPGGGGEGNGKRERVKRGGEKERNDCQILSLLHDEKGS